MVNCTKYKTGIAKVNENNYLLSIKRPHFKYNDTGRLKVKGQIICITKRHFENVVVAM